VKPGTVPVYKDQKGWLITARKGTVVLHATSPPHPARDVGEHTQLALVKAAS
jgi:hypothetical protein